MVFRVDKGVLSVLSVTLAGVRRCQHAKLECVSPVSLDTLDLTPVGINMMVDSIPESGAVNPLGVTVLQHTFILDADL